MKTLSKPRGTASLSIRKVFLLLVFSGLAAIGAIGAGAVAVYLKTQHLMESRDWVDHSQAVLSTLQMQNQRLERVDSSLQLYRATGNELHLRTAHTAVAGLEVGVLRLRDLVKDNPSERRHIQDMDQAVEGLSQALDVAAAARKMPEQAQRGCQGIVSLMLEEERRLLQQRTDESRDSLSRSLFTGMIYLAFSILIVSVLFGFLLRDAMQRSSYETLLSLTNLELATKVEEQARLSREAALLVEARDELQLCVSLRQAHDAIVRHFEMLLPGSRGATLTINNSRRMVEIAETWNNPETLVDGFELEACCGLRAGRARWRSPGRSEVNCTHFLGTTPEHYLCMPLAAHGETLGFVYVECASAAMVEEAESKRFLLNEMVELASMAIASLNLKAKLENQSIRDGLTNLFNRRYMESALERELHRAHRRKSKLAVMMIDVDHFKAFNDTFGHEAGDAVLREVAECLRVTTRAEDVVCRFGGEEFIMILPETSAEVAGERAVLIRKRIGEIQMHFRGDPLRKISVSVGISLYPEVGTSGEDLIREADKALYSAKALGRDRIEINQVFALA